MCVACYGSFGLSVGACGKVELIVKSVEEIYVFELDRVSDEGLKS